ncbi:hypothetical protein HY621_02355 [Candidatus Uhrbacteria bacterium]|nr:hypothetical protein [Candidatus Uhrbacteria bacterium]
MKNIIMYAFFLLIGGAVGFYGGTQYSQIQGKPSVAANGNLSPQESQDRFRQPRASQGLNGPRNGRAGAQGFGNGVQGAILKSTAKDMVVELSDKNTRIVLLSPDTEVVRCASGTKKDLKIGEQVRVTGMPNEDGSSISARIIQTGQLSISRSRNIQE